MAKEYDFAGWATRANLKCSDGRVIMYDAFKENDGAVVPIVWNHQHNSVNDVLGHGILKNLSKPKDAETVDIVNENEEEVKDNNG